MSKRRIIVVLILSLFLIAGGFGWSMHINNQNVHDVQADPESKTENDDKEVESNENIEDADEILDSIGLSEEEIYNIFHVFHGNVNTRIIFAYQEGIESDNYNEQHRKGVLNFQNEFMWLEKNYDFGTKYVNNLIKDVNRLIQAHVDGDNDALFTLKYVMYELDYMFNPEKAKEITAITVSLSNAEKIRKGEEPVFDYGT